MQSLTQRVVRGACPHDCPDTCALRVTVADGRVVRVQGDPDHPPTHGVLCNKVSRYAERTHSPERVLHPLKRIGPKGSGRFQRIGWDEALDTVAARLRAIAERDPEAIVPYSYAGTMGLVQGEGMATRVFHKLGASLLDRTICSSAGGEALAATYGGKLGMHLEHYAESKLIVIWGSNPITSSVHFWTFAQQAKRNGAKLWCIDPRRSETAEKCHHHLALLPGTDGALALALMHELIAHRWLDEDYIARHVEGFGALRERALTWSAGPRGRRVRPRGRRHPRVGARLRHHAARSDSPELRHATRRRGRQRGAADRVLPCLTGAWRHRAGGLLLSASGWFKGVRGDAALYKPELLAGRKPRTINMTTIGDDLLRETSPTFGPKIEALVVYNSNPVAVAPHSGRVVRGFAREDLFTVVLEHFMTDTADHADIVLPATTQPEHLDVHISYGHTYAMFNEPAIAPLGEAKPNSQIFRELAQRLGFSEPCFADDDEDAGAHRVARGWTSTHCAGKAGSSCRCPKRPSPTATSRRRVARCWWMPLASACPTTCRLRGCPFAVAARYPLAMISPPARNFLNSSFVNVASLREAEREPLLEMHPDDAAARGIADGTMVEVFNDRGRYHCRARIGERARPGVVNGLGVWWRKFGVRGTNVNELTSQRLTDIGRAPTFYDCRVEVRPA